MINKNDELQQRLLVLFADESKERLDAIASKLIELENLDGDEQAQAKVIEVLFREVHSLKGASRSLGLNDVESPCQIVETAFSDLKKGKRDLSLELLDYFHKEMDKISRLVDVACGRPVKAEPKKSSAPEQKEASSINPPPVKVEDKSSQVEPPVDDKAKPDFSTYQPEMETQESAAPSKVQPDHDELLATVRVKTSQLDSILQQVEELKRVKMALTQREFELKNLMDSIKEEGGGLFMKQSFLKVSQESWDSLQQIRHKMGYDRRIGTVHIDELVEDVKRIMMLPFSMITTVLQKSARDLARDNGKQATCVIEGANVMIDKHLLESLKDPLIHLIRNCVDHGIETPEVRKQKGKAAQGRIELIINRVGSGKVGVYLKDDGAGIDLQKLREQAIEKKLISVDQAKTLNDDELINLIFASGISTSKIITSISGRGLGMAIVKDTIEKTGGFITVKSEPGKGTEFYFEIPVTVSTYHGTVVKVSGESYIIPTRDLIKVISITKEDIVTIENRPIIQFNGEPVGLVYLNQLLGLKAEKQNQGEQLSVVMIGNSQRKLALLVDDIVRDQEILSKRLGNQLLHVSCISSAAVLSDGSLVLVLNSDELIKKAGAGHFSHFEADGSLEDDSDKSNFNVLLAEDSITARVLLQNILESAGYKVITAVDGADALATLKTEEIDILVSDVDMPRLNGFGLTKSVRALDKYKDIPIILVTARENREDREEGINVGADAYITKSSFEQSNLLEVMERLL